MPEVRLLVGCKRMAAGLSRYSERASSTERICQQNFHEAATGMMILATEEAVNVPPVQPMTQTMGSKTYRRNHDGRTLEVADARRQLEGYGGCRCGCAL